MSESRQTHVTLHDIDPQALDQLVQFAYTAEIVVGEGNVQVRLPHLTSHPLLGPCASAPGVSLCLSLSSSCPVSLSLLPWLSVSHLTPQTLLPAASLLQLNGVRDACCKFLLSQLDPSNCLGIRGFADTHSCSDLLKAAHRYVLQHFVDVAKTEEFMLLPLKQVTCQLGHGLHTDPALDPGPQTQPLDSWLPSTWPLAPEPLFPASDPHSSLATHALPSPHLHLTPFF